MVFRKTAIFCDLDGTLFNSSGTVSEGNRSAIRRYTENGGMFAIATGRSSINAFCHLDGVSVNAPCIILNGTAVYDCETGAYSACRYIDRASAAQVLRFVLKQYPTVDIQCYTEKEILYFSPEEYANKPFMALHSPCRFVSVEDGLSDSWLKCLLFTKPDETAAIQRYISENGLQDAFDVVLSSTDIVPGSVYLEFLPKNVNKGTAILACRSMPAFSGRTLIAVGDYWNDYEMILAADIGAAPGNALPEIRAASTVTLPDNNHDPLAALIRDFIPKLRDPQ